MVLGKLHGGYEMGELKREDTMGLGVMNREVVFCYINAINFLCSYLVQST